MQHTVVIFVLALMFCKFCAVCSALQLCFVLEFELPYEYRSGSAEDIQNCSIGPNIIRKLLTETLNEEWSIAVYVPYHKEQMNTTDVQRSTDFEAWNGSDLNPELIRERQEWIYRAKELKHCDMRQFFVPDSI